MAINNWCIYLVDGDAIRDREPGRGQGQGPGPGQGRGQGPSRRGNREQDQGKYENVSCNVRFRSKLRLNY